MTSKVERINICVRAEAQKVFSNMTPQEFMANPQYHSWFIATGVKEHYNHNANYRAKKWFY